MTNNNYYTYVVHHSDFKPICVKCGRKINDIELEYEDYFIVFRGHTPSAYKGLICFDCGVDKK